MFKFILTPANFLQYKPIILNPGDVSVVKLGRGDLTKIKDHKLSRNQVEFSCNFNNGKAEVTVMGGHPSVVNGKKLQSGETAVMTDGKELELLEGKYKYKLSIQPTEVSIEHSHESKKRKLSIGNDELVEKPEEKHLEVDTGEENATKITADLKRRLSVDDEELPEKKQREVETTEAESGGNGKAVVTSFLNGKKIVADSTWQAVDDGKLLIYTSEGVKPSPKIAAFDLDGTIITTASGKKFPKDAHDWKIIYPEVPKKLKSLIADGYKLVIITNQAGIEKGSVKVNDFKKKIQNILSKLGVSAQVFVSTGKTAFRKPSPNIWMVISHELNNDIPVDMESSFFCGDAAGREDKWAPGKKKDHSIADRLFALNVGLPFRTPEEYFLGSRPVKYKLPEFDPRSLSKKLELVDPPTAKITSPSQEVIVMVGPPGSGKSHFAQSRLVSKGYKWINRDTLKDWKKCVAELTKTLDQGLSAVIDNTSPDKESRARYIKAVGGRCPVRCFVMNTDVNHSKHNIKFREFTDSNHAPVPDVVIHTYRKNFVEPTPAEGFSEVVRVNFVPDFKDPALEERYRFYLLER